MTLDRKKIGYAIVAIVVLLALFVALMPESARVTMAQVDRGPMTVTVDEKGWTRVHDRFVVTAPVAGNLDRIALDQGDVVAENDVVAVLEPLPLDARQREEVLARVSASEAGLREARALASRAESNFELSRTEKERITKLAADGVASSEALDRAVTAEKTAERELEAARYRVKTAESELEVTRAGLLALDSTRSRVDRRIEIHAPISGEILNIPEKSARVVMASEPLLEIGDRATLEIVIELLSADAVKVHVGDRVILEEWGGNEPLQASVRVVEPSGFTKISALGIEEQRVHVIADIDDPPAELGDEYRIQARIVIWESDDVAKVPVSALFRSGEEWNVFVVDGGRASRRPITIGHRNSRDAEVLGGLEAGATVITHPGKEIEDGARVKAVE